MLQNISIEKLYPHPDNPRKDLGDLSELVESIRAQGILQNLTVVPRQPGYCVSCQLWNGSAGKCQEGYDKTEHPPCTKWESDGTYTVIIGHRRLAAAKEAGLTEVPCTVTEMTPSDQVATMLLENMQRNDLNLYEQACGIQMMFDLGENINSISDKTGLSKKTVQQRAKILKLGLDQDKFRESVMRGGTLMDYLALEKIEDPKRRNEVLGYIGTDNFKWKLNGAIEEEQRPKRKAALIKFLDSFARKVKDTKGLTTQYIKYFHSFDRDDFETPDDADTVEYVYTIDSYGASLHKITPKDRSKATPEEKEYRKKEAEMKELAARAYEMRYEFVKNFTETKKYSKEISEFFMKQMLVYGRPDTEKLFKILSIEIPKDRKDTYWESYEVYEAILPEYRKNPERVMLATAYLKTDDSKGNKYFYASEYCLKIMYETNKSLDMLYDDLIRLGYQMSDEEKALRDGTHELFDKKE